MTRRTAPTGHAPFVDRLWPRDLRKERAALSFSLKETAPSPGLREWFGHDPERYGEFARRYRAKLAGNKEEVARFEDQMKEGPVTLLYAAHDEGHNHALVLADYMRKYRESGHGQRPL